VVKRALLAVPVLALAACTTTVTHDVPGPTMTKTVVSPPPAVIPEISGVSVRKVDVPVPGPTVTITATPQYDSQDPFWNCWGDLINKVAYSTFCQDSLPN
jgi:hypothetical protein